MFSVFGLVKDLWKAFGKFIGLVPKGEVRPSWLQKEDCVASLFPSSYFMRVSTDPHICCDDDPIRLCSDRFHPLCVFGIGREFVSKMKNAVLWLDHFVQSVGDPGCKIVVEEELHAASDCSNSTALRTETELISNQRATSSNEPLARTLRERICVGMPSWNTIG